MKTKIALLAAVTFLLLPFRTPAQSTVPWSVSGMGYEVSSSPTTIVKSLVGQRFVGTLRGTNSIIESGFLADTLFRTAVTSIAEKGEVPKEYALEQNYPNPFNPSTTIRFELPHASNVSLKVYDLLGQEAMTLVDEERPAGVYEVRFNAQNLSSGMYVYRLRAGDYVSTKRMLVLK